MKKTDNYLKRHVSACLCHHQFNRMISDTCCKYKIHNMNKLFNIFNNVSSSLYLKVWLNFFVYFSFGKLSIVLVLFKFTESPHFEQSWERLFCKPAGLHGYLLTAVQMSNENDNWSTLSNFVRISFFYLFFLFITT